MFRQSIDQAIRLHDKLLVVLSEHSVTSDWVQTEVESAFERERREKKLVLFPVMLDGAVMDTDQAWAADIRRRLSQLEGSRRLQAGAGPPPA